MWSSANTTTASTLKVFGCPTSASATCTAKAHFTVDLKGTADITLAADKAIGSSFLTINEVDNTASNTKGKVSLDGQDAVRFIYHIYHNF